MNIFVRKFLTVFAVGWIAILALVYVALKFLNTRNFEAFNVGNFFLGVAVFAALTVAFIFFAIRYLARDIGGDPTMEEWLLAHGAKGSAEVVDVEDTGMTVDTIYPVVKLALKVSPADGSDSFRSVFQATVSRVSVPRRGDTLAVAYDKDRTSDIVLLK